MDKITFTLDEIFKHQPCKDGYAKLVKSLGGKKSYGKDTPITLKQIYDSNSYDDALWCLRTTPEETHYLWRHFAVDCAKQVEYLMSDDRSKNALVVSRAFADGSATEEDRAAAWAAAWAAWAAAGAAGAAAWDAAGAAAWAAGDAAWAAARAAAWAAAWAAVRAAVRAAQIKLLEVYCREGKRPENSVELLAEFIEEEDAK